MSREIDDRINNFIENSSNYVYNERYDFYEYPFYNCCNQMRYEKPFDITQAFKQLYDKNIKLDSLFTYSTIYNAHCNMIAELKERFIKYYNKLLLEYKETQKQEFYNNISEINKKLDLIIKNSNKII